MRNVLFFVIVLAAATGLAPVLNAQSLGSYPWGSSPREVARQTGAVPDAQGRGTLVKRESVLGHEAYLAYRFSAGGLSAVGIQWDSDLFNEIKKVLSIDHPNARCSADRHSCRWETPKTTLRLVEDPGARVTLLVVSPRSGT